MSWRANFTSACVAVHASSSRLADGSDSRHAASRGQSRELVLLSATELSVSTTHSTCRGVHHEIHAMGLRKSVADLDLAHVLVLVLSLHRSFGFCSP